MAIWRTWRSHTNKGGDDGTSGGTTSSLEAIGNLIDLKIGNLNVKVDKGTPELKIDYQGATQSGVYDPLAGKNMALHEGDKIQLHVTILGGDPRYVYLFWADTVGKVTCIWPTDKDFDHQEPVNELWYPNAENPDKWLLIDASRGVEMALVAVSDVPMKREQIAELTSLKAFTPEGVRPEGVYHFASERLQKEISRGLAGIVESQKSPISSGFDKLVRSDFPRFHGMVMEHKYRDSTTFNYDSTLFILDYPCRTDRNVGGGQFHRIVAIPQCTTANKPKRSCIETSVGLSATGGEPSKSRPKRKVSHPKRKDKWICFALRRSSANEGLDCRKRASLYLFVLVRYRRQTQSPLAAVR